MPGVRGPFGAARSGVTLAVLVVFSVAMGFVEAAVAYYLRVLEGVRFTGAVTSYKTLVNLGFIEFVQPSRSLLVSGRVTAVEVTREAATIVMLAAISYITGRSLRQRSAAFLVSFACWDLSYYVFLKVIDNWPSSLLTRDVFFLIPVPWIGPVITPVVISTVMLAVGVVGFLRWAPRSTERGAPSTEELGPSRSRRP